MPVFIAKNAGFCFGVRRAVDACNELASKGIPAHTLGPVIHNPQVVKELQDSGIVSADSIDDIASHTVIIRSHGVAPDVLGQLKAKGLTIIDATCPFVKRIHDIAFESKDKGIPLIIIGEKNHPEVMGIEGCAKELSYVVYSDEDIAKLPKLPVATVVAQTTITSEKFFEISAKLAATIPHITINNTICNTTIARQTEALEMAKAMDVMVVVGGRNSSNTRKLYEICKVHCNRTYLIETARELPKDAVKPQDKIGITAGASTPDGTFKEVVTLMNDLDQLKNKPTQEETQEISDATMEADFMADMEKTLVQIRPGQTMTGTVVQITEDEVCVNIGYKSDGLIKRSDLTSTDAKIGDEIEVEVVKVNDGEGNVILSQRNVVNRKFWDILVAKHEANEYVDGVGKEAVKGGLIANVMGIRAFIPASQLSQRYVEKIEEFVGKEMKLKIIEMDKAKKRIVASRKVVVIEQESSKKKNAWSSLTEGAVVKGVVRRLTDFGAFVDVGGVDGLVHVTDLSWGRIKHPSEVVSIGKEIQVKVLSLDPEKDRISLGYKQTQPKPWDVASDKYIVGSIVEGKVVRITTFGAFVELEPGLDGLVHISQCALTRIAKVEDAVKVGTTVRVKVLEVNTEAKRISLSIRAALEDEAFVGVDATEADIAGEFAIGTEE